MWEKVLHKDQDFPDNYVDSTFLQEMEKNVNVRKLVYGDVVWESFQINIHVTAIIFFVGIFIHLYDKLITPSVLIAASFLTLAAGYAIWDFYLDGLTATSQAERESINSIRVKIFSSSIILTIVLLGLSPLLKTLTKDISSDSLWAMTTVMLIFNAAFHDYTSPLKTTAQFPDSLSINAAIFSCVLLASRLDSVIDVFALMLIGLEMFAVFPVFQRYLRVFMNS
jgi:phosphatidylinositol glycan class C protein